MLIFDYNVDVAWYICLLIICHNNRRHLINQMTVIPVFMARGMLPPPSVEISTGKMKLNNLAVLLCLIKVRLNLKFTIKDKFHLK